MVEIRVQLFLLKMIMTRVDVKISEDNFEPTLSKKGDLCLEKTTKNVFFM